MSSNLEARNKVLRMAKREQEEAKKKETVNIAKIEEQLTGKKSFRSSLKPEIGQTWAPPMNASSIVFSSSGIIKKKADQIKLPESFSWNNPVDVKKYRPDLPENFLAPVLNQGDCGSCWAFATASTISDRWAIANKKPSPNLSPSFLLSCDTKDLLNLQFLQAQHFSQVLL